MDDPDPPVDAGPRGYLPPRAAQRARKIVLRERMALSWPVAALLVAVVVAVAGAAFLLTRGGPPGPPFVATVDLDVVPAVGQVVALAGADDVLLVRAGGQVQAYAAGPEVTYCPASGRLEAPDGRVWSRQGRLLGGAGESLRVLPTTVHQGVVYVNPTGGTVVAPVSQDAVPECDGR